MDYGKYLSDKREKRIVDSWEREKEIEFASSQELRAKQKRGSRRGRSTRAINALFRGNIS